MADTRNGWHALVAVLLSTTLLGFSADAANAATKRKAKSETAKLDKSEPMPQGPLTIVISLDRQRLYLYADGKLFAESPISSGTPGHPTPVGVFSVIQKNRHHRSNLYSNAPMPYMQRITWSGVAMHTGVLPGYPASHGCIRLPDAFASKLWRYTKMGARVIVQREAPEPYDIAHSKLFNPKPIESVKLLDTPAPALTRNEVKTAQVADATKASDAQKHDAEPAKAEVKAEQNAPAATPVVVEAKPVQPAEVTSAAEAVKPVEATAEAAKPVEAKPVEATAEVKPAEENKPAETTASTEAAKPADVAKPAEAAKVEPVKAEPAKVETSKTEDIKIEAPKTQVIKAEPAKSDDPARAGTKIDDKPVQQVIKTEPKKPASPVSVFVSRKTGKLYVRQGFEPLFETPVTIRDADKPMGTHVFTAMELRDGNTMRWSAVSMHSETQRRTDAAPERKGKKRGQVEEVAKLPSANPVPSAAEALDRLDIPQETVERIASMLVPGSSLMVSDNKLSDETGKGTDFIISTRPSR